MNMPTLDRSSHLLCDLRDRRFALRTYTGDLKGWKWVSDVGGDGVGVWIGKSRVWVLVVIDFGSIGDGLAGGLVFKPIETSATFSSRMSMPLDTIAMVWAITEVPSGTIKGLLVADLVSDRARGGGRLEMVEEWRHLVSFRIRR
jgi:hypothetical protein